MAGRHGEARIGQIPRLLDRKTRWKQAGLGRDVAKLVEIGRQKARIEKWRKHWAT
jgi:hypothetical protein